MGAGAAYAMKTRYKSIEKLLTDISKPVQIVKCNEGYLGTFTTKNHWRELASLELIQESTNALKEMAEAEPDFTIHCPYPGIGYGMLEKSKVEEIISVLPDNVIFYIV